VCHLCPSQSVATEMSPVIPAWASPETDVMTKIEGMCFIGKGRRAMGPCEGCIVQQVTTVGDRS
jgi:hypothetical protein